MNKPRTNQNIANQEATKFDVTNPEFLDSAELNESVERDFGAAIDGHLDGYSRRRWLQLMGASLALGGSVGCRYEEEKIAPFAFRPQTRIPGVPQKFATMIEMGGVADPLLATNYDGRPIKLDGNPKHPDSMGGSTTFTQARMLEFYCPDRLRHSFAADGDNWAEVELQKIIDACKFTDLSKVAVIAEPSASPSLLKLKRDLIAKGGSWHSFASINDDNSRAGSKLAFGQAHRAHYKFDEAEVIVTLDADPLGPTTPGNISNSIKFAKGRDADHKKMSRLYAVESQYTTTGSSADHRISVPSAKIAGFVAALTAAVSANKQPTKDMPYRERVLAAMASDLNKYKGKGIVLAGEKQPAEVHAAVHALNQSLDNNGATVTFTQLPEPDRPSSNESIKEFISRAGNIETLVILGGNPVFDGPQDLKLADAIRGVANSVHVTCFQNETSNACKFIAGAAHPLESWSDGFSNDGSILIGQPLINPLFGGKSILETLSTMMGGSSDGKEIIQKSLELSGAPWKKAVHDGFVEGSALEPVSVTAKAAPEIAADDSWSKAWDGETMEVVFNPSLSVYDGRFANNAWLQELPDFFTKVTWDNVASVSPKTAVALGVTQNGKSSKSKTTMMSVTVGGESITIPVAIQPGQADGSIGIEIGYGRTTCGRVGGNEKQNVDSVGQNVGPIRKSDSWHVASVGKSDVSATGTRHILAIVQEPWAIDNTGRGEIQGRMFRDYNMQESDRSSLIREGTFESYKTFLTSHGDHAETKPKSKSKTTRAVADATALPVIQPVAYTVPQEKHDEEHDDHGGHGGNHHSWPEAFHMHHELFDITPGAREDYKSEENDGTKTTYTNVWGMSIDLNKCIGCNSCVVACQSENNIPIVGKEEVWRGREMHWLRIDRYYGDNLYAGSPEEAAEMDLQMVHQPVTCHHCENAPCETVCPVAATVHSHEGLNSMVYNRCIGTRYCGNNCPYKVRRFNFFNYSDAVTLLKYPGADKLPKGDLKLQNLMMNPEVTVRSRGVMEKCTYCVQRIQDVKIKAKVEKRDIGPNEVTVACQDACPTQAIKFGDLHNEESDVAKAHANPRAYTMLEELNNRPRTKYLARVRNPHKMLVTVDDISSMGSHGHSEDSHDGDVHAKDTHAEGEDHVEDHAHEKEEKKDH
jgi:molybdopterin-containing oxidoreductase family iron-sulfur binding subunit